MSGKLSTNILNQPFDLKNKNSMTRKETIILFNAKRSRAILNSIHKK
jgi:hypothetical protein